MKGFKFLASCMAVGAVSVACAAASFAVDTTYKLTVSDYNATNGTIDITVPTAYAELVKGDYTLLVLSDDATSITEANKGIVKQIQQGDNTILTGVKVGTDLEKGKTYYVRVGGANATEANPTGFAAGTFKVESKSETPKTEKKLIGDMNNDDDVNGDDALLALQYNAGGYEPEYIDWCVAAYITEDLEDFTGDDVLKYLYYNAGSDDIGNIWMYGDFYYDEADDMYYPYGDLYEE